MGEVTRCKVLVQLNTGYYFPKDDAVKLNWWSDYFVYPKDGPEERARLASTQTFLPITSLPLPDLPENGMYLFTRQTFDNVTRNRMTEEVVADMYRKYIKLVPAIQAYVDQVTVAIKQYALGPTIGYHYRGSDKFWGAGDKEDMVHNRHMAYEEANASLYRAIPRNLVSQVPLIMVASDEEAFVATAREFFSQRGCTVIEHNSFRSGTNTSGLALPETTGVDPEHSKIMQQLKNSSVHRGHTNVCGHRKGRDALADVHMMASCAYYRRNLNGNFSSQPAKLNPGIVVI